MSLGDVVAFGLIYMVPMAPLAVFGIIYNFSHGMPALVYVVAGVAMVFSAMSYKEMAKRFPVAGSVYSYVRLGINRFFGFVSGWAILLDYLLLPALLSVFAAAAMTSVLPGVPEFVWVILFVVLAAAVNLRGITLTAGMNLVFLVIQCLVLAVFVIGAAVAVAQGRGAFTLDPVFRADEFSWEIVFGAIPIAALSYIGFDAISTLNEEAKGGGRTVSKATMVVLVVVTLLFVTQVYLAAVFVPADTVFADGDPVNNAFYDIAGKVVGPWFKVVITLTSALIAIFANSIASQATSSRLVFSMARDRQLPAVFAEVGKHQVPRNAMFLIAGLSLVIGIAGTTRQELLTTLVTFGALTAYILLNIAVIVHFGIRGRSRNWFLHWTSPLLGTLVLGYALWNADPHAQLLGLGWLLVGIGIAGSWAFRTRHPDTEAAATARSGH
ncbi:APC family permease [Kitasatospora sp. NPDC015120]|uniref:APC family permease n=1 Tax=Kitasatospora sp. NPDC015120 TaxID=3364023 RepID=UPI0036F49399